VIATATVTPPAPVQKGYRLERVGLLVDRILTRAEWIACGEKIAAMANATNWAIGDWLCYGNGRDDWGGTYETAHRLTGRSFESLSQYARVSRDYPHDQRQTTVCWTVHRAAVVLPPEDRARALACAAANGWTRDDMDRFIATRETVSIETFEAERAELANVNRRKVSKWRPADQQAKKRRIACPNCGHQFDIRRQP
jgi:hypothetical protein